MEKSQIKLKNVKLLGGIGSGLIAFIFFLYIFLFKFAEFLPWNVVELLESLLWQIEFYESESFFLGSLLESFFLGSLLIGLILGVLSLCIAIKKAIKIFRKEEGFKHYYVFMLGLIFILGLIGLGILHILGDMGATYIGKRMFEDEVSLWYFLWKILNPPLVMLIYFPLLLFSPIPWLLNIWRGYFFKKWLDAIAEGSKIDLFRKAGNCVYIGCILSITGIGPILDLVGNIF